MIHLSYNGELYSYDNKTTTTVSPVTNIPVVIHPYVDIEGAKLYYKQDDVDGIVNISDNTANIPGAYLVTGDLQVTLKLASGEMSNSFTIGVTVISSSGDIMDDDIRFTMDNKKRLILVPGYQTLLAIQFDNQSEIVTFKLPRYQEGVDLSTKVPYVNYRRPQVMDLGKALCTIEKTTEDSIYITWMVDARATQYSGVIQFQVEFADSEGYRWQSQIGEIPILASLYNTGLEPYNPGILEQYLGMIQEYSQQAAASAQEAREIEQAVTNEGDTQVQRVQDKGDDVLESIPADYTALGQDVNNLKSTIDKKAGMLVDTASGAIASFVPDSTIPDLLGVSVAINPVQDLHGYDHPWPGGGGENLFDKTRVTATSSIGVAQDENGFVLTCLSAGQYLSIGVLIPFTGHDGETLYLNGNVINSGSNNGYFSVRFYDDNGEISDAGGRLEIYSSRPSHYKTVPTGTTSIRCVIYATGAVSASVNDTTTFSNIMLSLTNSAYSPYSNICPIIGWTGATIHVSPSTTGGTTYPIAFPTAAGTVYGGTLDVTSGKLTADRASFDLGNTNWFKDSRGRFQSATPIVTGIKPTSSASVAANILCSSYKTISSNQTYLQNIGISLDSSGTCHVFDSAYSDAASFKAAVTGQTIVYELATPIEIQLDPVTISTISGQTNNVWADAGDVSVEFAADIKAYIDNKIAAAVAALS